MHHPTDRIKHTMACYTSSGALVGTRNRPLKSLKTYFFNGPILGLLDFIVSIKVNLSISEYWSKTLHEINCDRCVYSKN